MALRDPGIRQSRWTMSKPSSRGGAPGTRKTASTLREIPDFGGRGIWLSDIALLLVATISKRPLRQPPAKETRSSPDLLGKLYMYIHMYIYYIPYFGRFQAVLRTPAIFTGARLLPLLAYYH